MAGYEFRPEDHREQLLPILHEFYALEEIRPKIFDKVLNRHPKSPGQNFSKSELIQGVRAFGVSCGFDIPGFVRKLRMKPVRSESGVSVVAVLTKPFPCPGTCIFCPNDVRMPKSYLSQEPGAQRAAQHRFDPYQQVWSRLRAFWANGHPTEKIELIVLGGTWSTYPEDYQIWFIKRCFEAMNHFCPDEKSAPRRKSSPDYSLIDLLVDGRDLPESYNERVGRFLRSQNEGSLHESEEKASWFELESAHRDNEHALARCVGLVLETRPDCVNESEVTRLRRFGATKIQIGVQSLSDRVLEYNKRGHTVGQTKHAFRLLRRAGFKIQAHWMPNLRGATLSSDISEFGDFFADEDLKPDELKIYPCSLIENAELMQYYEAGSYRPYSGSELLEVLVCAISGTPRYCRLSRVIRDIPATDIFEGNRVSNLREVAEREVERRRLPLRDIRAREIRGDQIDQDSLRIKRTWYRTSVSRECFLEMVQTEDDLVAFLRLSLPKGASFVPSIDGHALVREIHVYGNVAALGTRDKTAAQHRGFGRLLLQEAEVVAKREGYASLSVISAVGTRAYYRALGYTKGQLYLTKSLV